MQHHPSSRPCGHDVTNRSLRLTGESRGQSGQGKWLFGQSTSCHREASRSWYREAPREHRLKHQRASRGWFCLGQPLPAPRSLASILSRPGLNLTLVLQHKQDRRLWAGRPRLGAESQA